MRRSDGSTFPATISFEELHAATDGLEGIMAVVSNTSARRRTAEAQRDLLEFRHTLEGSCAFYAAQRATPVDHERLRAAFDELQRCYAPNSKASRAEEGAADARFHLAIAEASHNAVLLHTIRGLFDLLKHNVVTNIGGLYLQRSETRERLREQHRQLFEAIIEGRADEARECSQRHIDYVQEVLHEGGEEAKRLARAQRRQGH